jgi:hypothetical protein
MEDPPMIAGNSPPFVTRNGHTLVVGIVARISGCQNQKEISLDDQVDHGKQVVAVLYDGPVEFKVIATKGKSERLDRPELADVEALLRSGELDLLVAEDLGRLVRGVDATRLCGIAVDHGVRVLAPNDCIDTADASWEEDVISACSDHVGHNAHTSKRLKHKLMNRFVKFGGATPLPIYGYIKTKEAKTFEGWRKDPAATPILRECLQRLRQSPNCAAVADWLNEQNVPTGKYCKNKTWDGSMVRRLSGNPLLKGMARRGFKHTIKHNESSRRVSVINPKGPQFKDCPHLAHVEPELWDEVNTLLKHANERYKRKAVDGVDPLWRVPRKRTRFPGQHARCWYCGRQLVWGANGQKQNLMCGGPRSRRCWNSLGFNGARLSRKLVAAITDELYRLDGFDGQFRELVEKGSEALDRRRIELIQREDSMARARENLLNTIKACGPSPLVQEGLEELEVTASRLARERRELEKLERGTLELPGSIAELRALVEENLEKLAAESSEFGDLMRQLVPNIHVYLVRSIAGGHLLPRARVELVLSGIVSDARHVPGLQELLTRNITVDLFEAPQREQIRLEAVRLASQGMEQRQIARCLEVTQPAVGAALALARAMRARGLESPYELVTEPPEDYPRLRRHGHGSYRFEPVGGYEPPVL